MHISKEDIEQVRRSHDLVQMVRSYGIELQRKGRHYMGLCPFHKDQSPSLVVSSEKQLWNCLGACSASGNKSGGDVIAFVAKIEGVAFIEALKRLGYGEPPGGASVRPPGKPVRTEASEAKERASAGRDVSGGGSISPKRRDLLSRVAGHYHSTLKESPSAQAYLAKRGLKDAEMLAGFQVGYSNGTLQKAIDSGTAEELRNAGLLTARGREFFSGCVLFPLTLPELGVVGLYGRHIKRDQHLYLPGPHRGVFHWQAMKGSREVIITESVIDALSLHQAGIRNVTAIYGVNGFTADHEELLQRFRVRRVLLCLDADKAGSSATETIAAKLKRLGIETLGIQLPGAKDANELLVANGSDAVKQAFQKALAEARHSAEGAPSRQRPPAKSSPPPGPPPLTEKCKAGGEPEASPLAENDSPAAQEKPHHARAEPEPGGGWQIKVGERTYRVRGLQADRLAQLRVNLRVDGGSKMHVETFDLYSQRSRSTWLKQASQELGVEASELAHEVNELVEILEELRLDLRKTKNNSTVKVEIPDAEREAALKRLRSPTLLDDILADFERCGFVGERPSLTVTYLATISRLLDDPLGILAVSQSGAGKSSLQDAVCEFVPEESLQKCSRLTGQALFYGSADSLVHKVLAIAEEEGAAAANYALRLLQSEQKLSLITTETDPQTGRHKAHEHHIKGPVAILLTTVSPEALDHETRNRFVLVSIDESPEQTRRILERQRAMDTLPGVLMRKDARAIRARQQTMQRLLRPIAVVNRYAPQLRYPDLQLQMRREHKKYLTLIKTIALLHQHQREVKREKSAEGEVEYIEVIPSDIALANDLARAVLGHGLDELAPPARNLLRRIVRMTKARERSFTRRDLKEATGGSSWSIRQYLQHLINLEYVVQTAGGNGRKMTYQLVFDGDPDEDRHYLSGLVNVEDLVEKPVELGGDRK